MTDLRKAAEMALEALGSDSISFKLEARVALRQALAEPEPWVKTYCGGKPNYCTPEERDCDNCESLRRAAWDRINELEAKLEQREWVGLTDEDKVAIYQKADDENWHDQPLLEAVEAKLKEKNA